MSSSRTQAMYFCRQCNNIGPRTIEYFKYCWYKMNNKVKVVNILTFKI